MPGVNTNKAATPIPQSQLPFEPNGLMTPFCDGTDFIAGFVTRPAMGLADYMTARAQRTMRQLPQVWMRKQASDLTCYGDNCHGGLMIDTLTPCELTRNLPWGKVCVTSGVFDESKLGIKDDPCNRAILAFRRQNIVPKGAPSWLFTAGMSNFELAANYYAFMLADKLATLLRDMAINGDADNNPQENADGSCYKQAHGILRLFDPSLYNCAEAAPLTCPMAGFSLEDAAQACGVIDKLAETVECLEATSVDLGLDASFAIAINPYVKRKLVSAAACCNTVACSGAMVDGSLIRQERNAMFDGDAIVLNEKRYPLVLDARMKRRAVDGDPTTEMFDMMVIPVRWGRGDDVTLVSDYVQYDAPGKVGAAISVPAAKSDYAIVDNGRFKITWEKRGSCLSVAVCTEPRFGNEAAFLSALLTDVGIKASSCARM